LSYFVNGNSAERNVYSGIRWLSFDSFSKIVRGTVTAC